MIKGGYYLKARKIQMSVIMRQPPHVREIWDWLIMNANHKDKKYNGFIVKRGQLFRSYRDILEGLSWYVGWRKMSYHENHAKTTMKILRKHGMITTKKALGGVLITIVNYDIFQKPENYENTTENTTENTIQSLREHQTPPNNNKNVKNEKNVKNKNNKDMRDFNKSLLSLFEILWKKYPIRKEKKKALEAFKALKLDNGNFDGIINALNAQIAHKESCDRNNRFCPEFPYLQRWLKNRRWEDETKEAVEIIDEEKREKERQEYLERRKKEMGIV